MKFLNGRLLRKDVSNVLKAKLGTRARCVSQKRRVSAARSASSVRGVL